MKFCIALSGGRRVTPAAYLGALRLAQANPSATFNESFRDRFPASGAEIVAEHFQMLRERWAGWTANCGKGNRAARRAQALRDAAAKCHWCGTRTGSTARRFCCSSCARSYNS